MILLFHSPKSNVVAVTLPDYRDSSEGCTGIARGQLADETGTRRNDEVLAILCEHCSVIRGRAIDISNRFRLSIEDDLEEAVHHRPVLNPAMLPP